MKQYFRQLLKHVMPGLTNDMHGVIDFISSASHVIPTPNRFIPRVNHVITSPFTSFVNHTKLTLSRLCELQAKQSSGLKRSRWIASPSHAQGRNDDLLSPISDLKLAKGKRLESLTWRTFTHFLCLIPFCLLLTNCSSIQTPITDQYRLSGYSHQVLRNHPTTHSILVNKPEAVAGYETNQMLYINKPYELTPFAHNAWVNPPAEMLFPLIVESLQTSGYFFAVASSPTAESTQYRIDTQLIELHQNFLVRPSVIELTVKVVLTDAPNNHVIASKMIKERVPCVKNTPYGGVMAANEATRRFTAELTRFVSHALSSSNKPKNTKAT